MESTLRILLSGVDAPKFGIAQLALTSLTRSQHYASYFGGFEAPQIWNGATHFGKFESPGVRIVRAP